MSAGFHATSQGPLGYRSQGYVETLQHIGTPLSLAASGGFLLERGIPGTSLQDACGPYPLLTCADWSALSTDLEQLEGLVSVVAVLDPLGAHDAAQLARAFPDLLRPFKRHYLVDLRSDFEATRTSQHRRKVRRAQRQVIVERAEAPYSHREEWHRLYRQLVARHGFEAAPADFSREGLEAQLALEGATYYRALIDGECEAAYVFLRQGDCTYYHLGTSSDVGRGASASYALIDAALRDAADSGLRMADLGGTVALDGDGQDGLSRFKSGWSTDSASAYLAGRILDPKAYHDLAGGGSRQDFFPAYRGARVRPEERR